MNDCVKCLADESYESPGSDEKSSANRRFESVPELPNPRLDPRPNDDDSFSRDPVAFVRRGKTKKPPTSSGDGSRGLSFLHGTLRRRFWHLRSAESALWEKIRSLPSSYFGTDHQLPVDWRRISILRGMSAVRLLIVTRSTPLISSASTADASTSRGSGMFLVNFAPPAFVEKNLCILVNGNRVSLSGNRQHTIFNLKRNIVLTHASQVAFNHVAIVKLRNA